MIRFALFTLFALFAGCTNEGLLVPVTTANEGTPTVDQGIRLDVPVNATNTVLVWVVRCDDDTICDNTVLAPTTLGPSESLFVSVPLGDYLVVWETRGARFTAAVSVGLLVVVSVALTASS